MSEDAHLRDTYMENFPGIAYVARIDFVPLLFDGAVEEITGYTSKEFLIGTPRWDQIVFQEDLSDQKKGFDSIRLEPNTKLDREYRIRRKDGGIRWVHDVIQNICNEEGVPFRVAGTLLDITRRKLLEAELREREARLQSVFRAAPVGIGVASKGVLQNVNQTLCDMVGYDGTELLGHNTRMLYMEDEEFEFVGREMERQMRASGAGMVETRWVKKDDSIIEVLLSSSPIQDESLQENVSLIAMDITEKRRVEREQQRLRERILHTQKLESLGVLAGGIAHDFNNLLMGILGNASLAMMDLTPTSPIRGILQDIEKASLRAADLCRQMLAYSGKGKFIIEQLNLSDLVREMTHLLEVSLSKKALLRYDFADDLPLVEADATQIRQVIMNLITNASEAIGDRDGTITVSTGVVNCDRDYLSAISIPVDVPEGVYAFIQVSDTGCGMDPDAKARLFDPFFTTKFTGRGLGLSAVLGIIKGHKGAIQVYTELGRGSTFKIYLPTTQTHPPHETERPSRVPHLASETGGIVLLVDDDERVRAVGSRMLQKLGFEVLLADDGREALEIFRERSGRIACIILDLTMPHMAGEECFTELRRIRPDVSILLSSGYNEQDVTQRFTGKGLAGFIQKPYVLETLSQKLSEALHR